MLLIDYGFPAREFYHPQREQGSLICHYRHRTHYDPFWWPGLSDITAHVDFSALHDEAQACGLDLLGYTSQAHFLLGCGLLEHFAAETPGGVLDRARQAQAVQQLVSEAEMGELFKVIAFGRGAGDDPPLGFSSRDRSAMLD
jgi:SAM-dependent MidA family methyltransferase